MLVRGWLRRVGKFLNPGIAGLLFILFFIILFAIIAPIALRIGKLFVEPILWLYESRGYSVGLSLTGSIIPAVVAIALAGLLHRRKHRVVPTIMANKWFWVFVIIYVVIITALPVMSSIAAAVILSLNAPMMIAAPLIFIAAFGLARDVNEGDYWVAAEAYITLFIPLVLSDSTTALMAGVATETVHLFTKASLVIGGYGVMDGLILIPIEAAIAALITVVAVRHLDVLKIVFKNALVDIGLSVLIFTGVLLSLRYVPYNLAGPIFGATITLFATGLYSVTNYLSTTTTLSHELDVECWSDDCRRSRISALVRNEGRVVVRDAKGVVSINRGQPLAGLLIENLCRMLVNPVNPHVHVNGEALAWASPEKPVYMPAGRVLRGGNVLKKYVETGMNLVSALIPISDEKKREIIDKVAENLRGLTLPLFTTYNHVTSISPGQRSRLLIFDYEYNWWSNSYVIKVHSEYGGPGLDDITPRPYRACLLLDDSTKYEFEITVHGEGLREPFLFKMYVVKDKLDALVKSIEVARLGGEDMVMDVLGEFDDNDEGFINQYWRIRNRILEVKSLDEYKSVAKELESLWNEVRNKLSSRAPYFGIATGILSSYLVYLAAIGKRDEAKKLFEENEKALNLEREGLEIESNVLTKLMLSRFGVDRVEVKVDKLINSFEKHLDAFVPALKLIFGIYSDEKVALNECNSKHSGNMDCVNAVKALSGDANALDSLKNKYEELKQFLAGLDAKNFILAYSPETPCARLALILHMLGQGDAKSVGALAYVGWRRHTQLPGLENLFREVYNACSSDCNIDNNEQLKLALLKLYHRLV